MRVLNRFMPVWLLMAGLSAGCTTPTITNLTPSQLPRNADGLYRFEAAWRSRQQSLRKESIQPSVMIGFEKYPMKPIPVVSNQWEAIVPVPAEKEFVNYQFRFDFQYYSIPVVRPNSRLSPTYQLRIVSQPAP